MCVRLWQIDTESLADRKRGGALAAQQAAWAEAQALFKERVAARQPPIQIEEASVSE